MVVLVFALVLAVGLFVVACGTNEPATTTAVPATEATASGSTDTTGAASTDTTAANTTPIKIGIAISLTGDSAAAAAQIKQGFDTEGKYMNANGGINGRQVELVFVDDQSKMDTSSAAIQALVDQKCDVIIGPFPQWCQAPTREITDKAGILHIAFGPPTIEELNTDQSGADWKYYFMPATGPDGCSDAFVRELKADGRKNVLGVGDQMTISQETLQVLAKSLPASGIQFSLMSDSWSLGETDITPFANKIAVKAKDVNPDAIVLATSPIFVNQMTKILRSLGVKVPIYNEAAGAHPLVMLAPAGNDPANVAGDYAFGPAIVNPAAVPDSYPAKADLVAFVERWKADNPKEYFASLFLGFAYDTIHLAEQAIKTAATQDEAGWPEAMTRVD